MKTEQKAFAPARGGLRIGIGVRYMMLGSVLFSMGAASIKLAGDYLPPSLILFARALVGLGFCLWVARRAGIARLGTQRWLLFARGIFGAGAFFAMINAYVRLPLADATVIIFLHPVLVAVLASFVLKEKMAPAAWLCILASLAGVTLVARPGFLFSDAAPLDHLGVIMALTAVFCSSTAILAVRKLAATEHPVTIMLYPLLIILVAAPVAGGSSWPIPTPTGLLLITLAGIFMNAGQYFMTKGYAREIAATISAVGYLEIVFAAFWGLVIFGDVPAWTTVVGSVLIVGSTYWLSRVRKG